MLKLGDKTISKLYLGSKAISKAYLGDKLVFQAGKPIFLDYIITDGNSYIDTEYCPNENTYIEYTCELTEMPTQSFQGLFGSRQATSTLEYSIFARSTKYFRLDFGRYFEPTPTYPITLNTKIAFKAGLGEIYVNNELVKTYTPKVGQSPYSMYLGNFNQAGAPYTNGTPQRIYPCPIYENGVLVRDLRPCIDHKGVVCMYDMVTKKYFYNQGTGTLKAGGRFVKSIIFDGNSWIDTGITTQDCTVKTAVKYEAGHSRSMLTGFSSSGGYWGMTAGKMLEMNGGVPITNTNLTNYSEIELVFNVSEYRITATINGETGSTVSTTGFGSLTETYTIGCSIPTSSNKVIGNVYYSTFNNADGVLIQDLRPYVDEDGVACFKDVVTNTLFYGKGTGTLGYTEE